jgi:hypothetical protein
VFVPKNIIQKSVIPVGNRASVINASLLNLSSDWCMVNPGLIIKDQFFSLSVVCTGFFLTEEPKEVAGVKVNCFEMILT